MTDAEIATRIREIAATARAHRHFDIANELEQLADRIVGYMRPPPPIRPKYTVRLFGTPLRKVAG